MNYIYISIIILLAVVLLVPKSREKAIGICKAALGQSRKKEERKNKILELLSERGEMTNSDIREATGISRRSIVNYINELEKEGKVEQVGDAGRSVKYRVK
ncbi:MAG: SelB C-terminal domain-containing protein [Candidatus Spechtbacterales bacterium]